MTVPNQKFTLGFFGAAETVTGSRYLLESEWLGILVDCGLFQGYKKLRQRNWAAPGFDPSSLDAVVLTHAHLDHAGYLPRLVAAGYAGPVFCTPGTRDLLRILLPDAGHLQEEEARFASRAGFSKHEPPLPLFTRDEALRCLEQVQVVDYGVKFAVAPGANARFSRAGHIVGSSSVWFDLGDTSVVFSGDVGRPNDPIMSPPEPLEQADYLVVESTYGDRRHSAEPAELALAHAIDQTVARGGVVVIPAFAVGRAQHILHLLAKLRDAGKLPRVPIFLDSPMAIDATEIYRAHVEEHRLSRDECAEMCRLATCTRTANESKAIDAASGPMIIISASGMATGGRVLHHLQRFLPEARNSVLLVGYQSAGTRGRSLADGVQELKIHGQYIPVRAQIAKLDGLSAHADYAEIIDWLRRSKSSPVRAFVTHGEPAAADAMRRRLRDELGWDAVVPDHAARFPLSGRKRQ